MFAKMRAAVSKYEGCSVVIDFDFAQRGNFQCLIRKAQAATWCLGHRQTLMHVQQLSFAGCIVYRLGSMYMLMRALWSSCSYSVH